MALLSKRRSTCRVCRQRLRQEDHHQTSEKPKELIKAFRVDPFPRIAGTVDMIATVTDIKPVECLIFMRDVKSVAGVERRAIKNPNIHVVVFLYDALADMHKAVRS